MKLSFVLLMFIVPLALCILLFIIITTLVFQRLFKPKSSERVVVCSRLVSWEEDGFELSKV